MNMLNERDLADFAIDFGLQKGAKYVDARLIEVYEEDYIARNGMFISIQDKKRKGMGIRTIVDGGMAFGSTEVLTKDSIQQLINDITKMARASKRKAPIEFSEEKAEQTTWSTEVKRSFADVSKQEKKDYIKYLDKRLKRDVQGKLSSRIIVFILYSDNKYYINSEGTKIESKHSLGNVMTMNTARSKNGVEQRNFGQGGSGGWEWFENVNFDQMLVEDCQGLAKASQYAMKKQFEKPIDVVISGEVAGIICHENVGHPSEADRILGREGAQAGESFYADLLKEGKIGEIKLGTENVTIIDDPTIPGTAGFYIYDDEGVKARPRFLIKNGNLNELLLNREYAARLGLKSNAASRSVSFEKEPITRMANTYFAPGDFNSLDELFEDIKEGIYMKTFTEWNIDDRRFQSKYVGLEVYLIENGKLTDKMIKRPVLELTTKGILESVDAVTKQIERSFGQCGKGDPMQGIPVSMGGACVRLRNIRVGGGQ